MIWTEYLAPTGRGPEEPRCKESQVACSQQQFGVPEASASEDCTGSPAPRLTDVAGRAPDFHPFRAARQGHERLVRKAA
jgi:hypothetical protein